MKHVALIIIFIAVFGGLFFLPMPAGNGMPLWVLYILLLGGEKLKLLGTVVIETPIVAYALFFILLGVHIYVCLLFVKAAHIRLFSVQRYREKGVRSLLYTRQ